METKKKKPTDQELIKGKKEARVNSSHEENVERLKQVLEHFIDGDQMILSYKPGAGNKKAKKHFAHRIEDGELTFANALVVEASTETQFAVAKQLIKSTGVSSSPLIMMMLLGGE